MAASDNGVLAKLFRDARTFSYWQTRQVPKSLVEAAFELACLGPTSGNCLPMRLVLVQSPAAKERLLPCVSSGNYEKVRTAPITAIVAYDREFFELLPRLYPHADARGWFTSNPALVEETGLRNSSLQGAYFMLALRAQGLDCGPMSGFDADKVDAAFFPDCRYRTNFLLNIGYGDRNRLHPRLSRLDFDEVANETEWAPLLVIVAPAQAIAQAGAQGRRAPELLPLSARFRGHDERKSVGAKG